MPQWLEYLGSILVVGFILLLILISCVIYPLWSAYQGIRELRPRRSWTFSLRSLLAAVVASAFVVWFLERSAGDWAGLEWQQPSTWLFMATPALVLFAYAAIIWFLASSTMERRDRNATQSRFQPDDIEIWDPDAATQTQPVASQEPETPKRTKRRWWVRRMFGGYPALRSGRMPESPPDEDD